MDQTSSNMITTTTKSPNQYNETVTTNTTLESKQMQLIKTQIRLVQKQSPSA